MGRRARPRSRRRPHRRAQRHRGRRRRDARRAGGLRRRRKPCAHRALAAGRVAASLGPRLRELGERARADVATILDRAYVDGAYRDRAGAPPTVRAHADAIELAELWAGAVPAAMSRDEHIAALRGLQDPTDGLVPELGSAHSPGARTRSARRRPRLPRALRRVRARAARQRVRASCARRPRSARRPSRPAARRARLAWRGVGRRRDARRGRHRAHVGAARGPRRGHRALRGRDRLGPVPARRRHRTLGVDGGRAARTGQRHLPAPARDARAVGRARRVAARARRHAPAPRRRAAARCRCVRPAGRRAAPVVGGSHRARVPPRRRGRGRDGGARAAAGRLASR